MTLGCFNKYMQTQKRIAPNTNDLRKAYYYIDEVSLAPQPMIKEEVAFIPVDTTTVKPKTNGEIVDVLLGSCYRLHNLNFETDKAEIKPESYSELQTLSKFLKTYPYITVYIEGHADKTGTNQHNDKLSEARANAVKEFLVNEGIDASRLVARSYGESLPVDDEHAKSFANSRVEITICSSPETSTRK